MRRYLWLMIMVGAAAALVVWQWRQRSLPVVVHVADAKSAPLVTEWTAVGYVESRTAQVSAPQVGWVERVLVREGERVRAGQLLATLRREAEEAGVSAQRAGLEAALAQAAASRATMRQARATQADRERRARAETTAARERWRQAVAMLERSRKILPARIEALRSEAEAARAVPRDLERGGRPEEIAQAQAELRAAEATVSRARAELERQRQLYKEGAAARRAVEDAQEALVRAESALSSRQEALGLLRRGAREEQIAAARARVRSADASLVAAEGELAGLEAEERRVEEARAALRAAEAAEAEVKSARAGLEALAREAEAARALADQNRAALKQAAAGLSERAVFAPYDGVVGRRFVDPGDMASPAQPLFSIVEDGRTWVAAEVDEQDIAPVTEGQRVSITAPAFAGREFSGIVVRIGGEAVPQTEVRTGARILRVRVSLDPTPPDRRSLLKPGMEVHVSGRATLVSKAILVPSDSLLTDGAGAYVWTVEKDRTVRRNVRPGYVNGPETEIISGLRGGEKVVVRGKEGLRDGQAVEARRYRGEA